ncbi:MAG: GAF and ANTAR domain-containing protein [Janthinobacterium lividum]
MVPSRPPRPAGAPGGTGRAAYEPATELARLQQGVELVVQLVDGCDHAGVTVSAPALLETVAASDHVARQGDAWQYELGEGPCLEAVRQHHTVLSQDLRADARWATWGPRVVDELGVRSMLSLLLFTHKNTFAALNLYGNRSDVWDDDQLVMASALAEHLAVAAADAREIENRGRSMITRTMIGQAEGILMERFDLSADRAFEYLRRISQGNHTKLVDVAREIVETRTLPAQRTMSRGVAGPAVPQAEVRAEAREADGS